MTLLGVCYYPEHWPEERWAQDATQMRALGLDLVRIAEFAWARMEPAEGRFDWGWLDRAVETLAGAGLKLALGTPTPAPPAWLVQAHPDILPVDAEGRRRRHGGRRHVCANAPAFQTASDRIVAALAKRYGQHPALVGWQTDNEFGGGSTIRCYCDHCAAAFRRWLQARYGSLDQMNEAWGAVFWSQWYTEWDQIQLPNLVLGQPNPSHVLDYYRFSSDSWVAYQRAQIRQLRELSPGRWVTHNLMGPVRSLDYYALAADLDFVSWDNYPTGNTDRDTPLMYGPGATPPPHGYDVGDPALTAFYHTLMRGLKRQPVWIMEQQPGYVNWGKHNPTPRPGVVRYWTLEDFAHGTDTVVYFRWRACHYAQEQFHSGLLKHDGTPDQGFQEVAGLDKDRDLLTRLQGTQPQADVALLYSYEDDWAAALQPHHADFDVRRAVFALFRAFQRAGHAVDIVHPRADLSSYRLVVAPTLWLVDETLTAHLRAYVEGGGTLLIGPRSGFKTPSNLVHPDGPPGLLADLVGAKVTGFHSLPPGVTYGLRWPDEAEETPVLVWAEGLEPGPGVEAVATWGSGLLEGQAALTLRTVGNGQVAYFGAWPSDTVADSLVAWLAHVAGVWELAELPAGVTATRRDGPDQEYLFLVNGTDEYQMAALYPPAWADARSGEPWPATVTIPPRDVLVGARPHEAG
ncbi:MAG: beta-galactosidase [Anaerolineae bacterium]|nr:beta-galactosidase [Anaerolineae bacterium]